MRKLIVVRFSQVSARFGCCSGKTAYEDGRPTSVVKAETSNQLLARATRDIKELADRGQLGLLENCEGLIIYVNRLCKVYEKLLKRTLFTVLETLRLGLLGCPIALLS
jgi:hypothetical protein